MKIGKFSYALAVIAQHIEIEVYAALHARAVDRASAILQYFHFDAK